MWRVLKEGLQLPPHSVWPCQQGKIHVDPTPVLDLCCYRVKIEAAFLNLQTTSKNSCLSRLKNQSSPANAKVLYH